MNPEARHDALVKALDAIAGVNAVPHCFLPMLAAQTLFVRGDAASREREKGPLEIYTDAGLESLHVQSDGFREMPMSEILALIEREGRDGLVIDPGLPRRLPIGGTDLEALRSQVGKTGSESFDCESGSELALAAPDPLPPEEFLQILNETLRAGGHLGRAWLFETILPGSGSGELCVGVEPGPETDVDALERRLGDVAQKHARLLGGRSSLTFLPLRDPELIDVVRSVGLPLDAGAAG